MKNTFKVLGFIGLMLVIGFSFVTCGGDDGGNPQTVTYTGTSGGQLYSLKVTEDAARYTAKSGDSYELTVGSKKSTGTVTNVSGGVLTLKPSNAATTFTATVSGSSLTAMNGTITWTDNTTATAPSSFGGDEDEVSLVGTTWKYEQPASFGGQMYWVANIITFSDSTTVQGQVVGGPQPVTSSGTYTISGNSGTIKLSFFGSGDVTFVVNGNKLTVYDLVPLVFTKQ